MNDSAISQEMDDEAGAPCIECGASPDGMGSTPSCDEETSETQNQWVYCYEKFQPKGLCNVCYRLGRTSRFTAFQREYLRKMFEEDHCDPSYFGRRTS